MLNIALKQSAAASKACQAAASKACQAAASKACRQQLVKHAQHRTKTWLSLYRLT